MKSNKEANCWFVLVSVSRCLQWVAPCCCSGLWCVRYVAAGEEEHVGKKGRTPWWRWDWEKTPSSSALLSYSSQHATSLFSEHRYEHDMLLFQSRNDHLLPVNQLFGPKSKAFVQSTHFMCISIPTLQSVSLRPFTGLCFGLCSCYPQETPNGVEGFRTQVSTWMDFPAHTNSLTVKAFGGYVTADHLLYPGCSVNAHQ